MKQSAAASFAGLPAGRLPNVGAVRAQAGDVTGAFRAPCHDTVAVYRSVL